MSRRSTAIGRDERFGGSGLLHHVPTVSAVTEGRDVDHDRARSAGGVCVRVRGGQAAGRRSARMGRLPGPLPGQVQRDLRGEKVLSVPKADGSPGNCEYSAPHAIPKYSGSILDIRDVRDIDDLQPSRIIRQIDLIQKRAGYDMNLALENRHSSVT